MNEPLQTELFDSVKPESEREPNRVAQARRTLETMYRMLDANCALHPFATGDQISLADVAAAPPVHLLRELHPFTAHENLNAYYERLSGRASFRTIAEESAPYFLEFGLSRQ